MLRKTLLLAGAALLAVLATSSPAQAWGGASLPTFSPGAGHINPAGRPTPNMGWPYGVYPVGVPAWGFYRRW